MLRELTYTSIRAGCYEPIKHMLGGTDRHDTPLHIKLRAGGLAGEVDFTIAVYIHVCVWLYLYRMDVRRIVQFL